MVIIRVGNNWPGSSVVRVMPRAHGPSQDAANGQEKIDRGVLGEVEDALDEAAILAEDLEGKITSGCGGKIKRNICCGNLQRSQQQTEGDDSEGARVRTRD